MDVYPETNCSRLNLTNKTCFNFSSQDFEAVFGTKVGLASLAGLACCVAILLIIFYKAHKRFVHRLTLYLAIAAFVFSITLILQVLPVKARCHIVMVTNEQLCLAAGFLCLFAEWYMLLFMTWITLHLFVLAVFRRNYKSRKYEVGGVVICHVFPLLICIVPLINFKHGTMYGLAGAWCWVRVTGESCQPYEEGLIEQFTLWYGPLLLAVLFNFLVIAITVIALYLGTRETSTLLSTTYQLQNQYREALKEAMPLLFYPIFYNIICFLAFANRVYYAATNKVSFPLWIIHAVVDPCLPLFIPVGFLLHPYTLKKLKCSQIRNAARKWRTEDTNMHGQTSSTYFVVSKEDVCTNEENKKLIVTQDETPGYHSIF